MKKLTKEDLYKISIVSFVFLIIVFIVLFSLNKNRKAFSEPIIEPDEKQFTLVNNYNIFYFVNNNINTFIMYTIEKNKDGILNFLDEDYKKEQMITYNNIENKIELYNEEDYYMAKLTKSYQLNDKITVYYTEGNILNEGFDGTSIVKRNVKYLLYVDYENMICSLEIINEEKSEEELNSDKTIYQNNFNQVKQIELVSIERICSIYMADYFTKIANNEAYKITTNYNTIESFNEFYNNNYLISEIKSCAQNNNENGNRIYTIIDKNNYRYQFVENNILDYTVSISK